MRVKIAKFVLVVLLSALIIWGLLSLIYGNLTLKVLYYKLISPLMKY